MKILVVEDNPVTLLAVKSQLENPGNETPVGQQPYIVTAAAGREQAEAALDRDSFDYAFIDLKLGQDRDAGLDLLRHIVRQQPSTICIMMTSNNADETVTDCLRNGASDYIIKPFEARIVHDIMRKARAVHRLWQSLRASRLQTGKSAVEPIWLESKSPVFQKVIERARKLRGKQNIAVFIAGERGAGKEVMARFLWTIEEDETRVFIPVHTGSLPKELVESELFGYRKGAFSGATENKIGKFEAADGGDIFLDEIATMSIDTQVKLLRVLQQKEVAPLGSGSAPPKKVNVRVISATNEDVHALADSGRFRADLLDRMQMVTLEIPPLRERMEDMDDLVAFFLRKAALSHKRLSADAWAFCRSHHWPGNVRELEHAITVAAELADSDEVGVDDLRASVRKTTTKAASAGTFTTPAAGGPYGLDEKSIQGNFSELTENFEQALIRFALDKTKCVSDAAKFLRLPRTTLISKMSAWGWKE